uniref:Uncharacterized protein n=1 Tax=Anguilla anguilla TaxID=7936 RepID=A0A0E9QF30_ANGAN
MTVREHFCFFLKSAAMPTYCAYFHPQPIRSESFSHVSSLISSECERGGVSGRCVNV